MARDPLSSNYDSYASRVQQRLYAQYRTRLDEDSLLRQQRRDVIDVAAQRVEVEKSATQKVKASRASQKAISQESATQETAARSAAQNAAQRALSQYSDSTQLAMANRQRVASPDSELANAPFMYERPADSMEISLKNSPIPRGMFVDLMA